jgi:hypothetical protein
MTLRLLDWALDTLSVHDVFKAPEQIRWCLFGEVHGHPREPDGTRVKTSPIVAADGRRITTASGSTYELVGEPHEAYRAWLVEHGREYDADEPIKVGGRK